VRTAGSSPSERLVAAVHDQLGVPLKSVYGSTEGGGIAFNILSPGDDVAIAGSLVSGVELEIAQDDTEAKDQAEVFGKIRYRGKGLASGYLGSTDSDSSFKEGWFYPGDAGYFDLQGRLVLAGRTDELLNVGGTKVNPSTIEDAAVTFTEISDAAICLIERVPGVEEVAIGICVTGPFDSRDLDKALRSKFPTSHPTIFMTVREIPRNQMGKIMRDELKAQILTGLSGN
jgi:acyl-coenzyme A synthetase/AMP-(fatty) acid ligase